MWSMNNAPILVKTNDTHNGAVYLGGMDIEPGECMKKDHDVRFADGTVLYMDFSPYRNPTLESFKAFVDCALIGMGKV